MVHGRYIADAHNVRHFLAPLSILVWLVSSPDKSNVRSPEIDTMVYVIHLQNGGTRGMILVPPYTTAGMVSVVPG